MARDITQYMPDDEDERLRAMSAPQPQPQPAAAPPPQQQPQPMQPGPWSRAQQLLGGGEVKAPPGEQRRFQMPDRGPSKAHDMETMPEYDSTRSTLLSIFDVLANRGQNIGSIIGADARAYSGKVDQWRQNNSPEAILKRQGMEADIRNKDREGLEANNRQFWRMKQLQLEQQQAKDAQANRDREFTRQTGRDAVSDQRWETEEDRANRQLAAQTEHQKALEAQARAQTGLGYARLNADQRQFDAAQAGLDRRQGEQIAAQTGMNDADNAAATERARIQAEARAAAAAARQPGVDARLTREFNKDTEYEQSLASLLDGADQLTPKQGDIPGVGVYDGSAIGRGVNTVRAAVGNKTGMDAERMTSIKGRLADLSQRMVSGAAGPVSEEVRYQIQVGAQPGATESEFRTAMKLAREHVGGKLKSASAGREGAARSVLGSRGLGSWLGEAQPAAPQAPQAPQGFDPAAYGAELDEDEEQ